MATHEGSPPSPYLTLCFAWDGGVQESARAVSGASLRPAGRHPRRRAKWGRHPRAGQRAVQLGPGPWRTTPANSAGRRLATDCCTPATASARICRAAKSCRARAQSEQRTSLTSTLQQGTRLPGTQRWATLCRNRTSHGMPLDVDCGQSMSSRPHIVRLIGRALEYNVGFL